MMVYCPRRSDEQWGYVVVATFAIGGVGLLGTIVAMHPERACTAMTTNTFVMDHRVVMYHYNLLMFSCSNCEDDLSSS